jgi:hypothetical protein
MAYTRTLDYRHISNKRLASRYKQFFALIAAIVVGMIISAAVNALPSSKPQMVSGKADITATVRK